MVVAPHDPEDDSEVIYALDLGSNFHGELLQLYYTQEEAKRVNTVRTRSMARAEEAEGKRDAAEIAVEKPKVTSIADPVRSEVGVEELVSETGGAGEESEPILGDDGEELMFGGLVDGLEPSVAGEEEYAVRGEGSGTEAGIDLPTVATRGDRAKLVKETKNDPTLATVRALADKGEKGYSWSQGLIMLEYDGDARKTVKAIVVPESFRTKILSLAHDKIGHLSVRKVKYLIRQNFSWPHLTGDVAAYCKSCEVCQRMSKTWPRKVPLVERKIMTEPHESLAFDIVGPLPLAKGGCQWILTCLDKATKWPEAIPLKSITARSIAREMLNLFARTGIPREILTDQGTQFVGSLVTKLCKELGVDQIHTTPYRPESNGLIERMHKTLGSVLRKCASEGKDWVVQLPLPCGQHQTETPCSLLMSCYTGEQ